jgi:hypothetical protein
MTATGCCNDVACLSAEMPVDILGMSSSQGSTGSAGVKLLRQEPFFARSELSFCVFLDSSPDMPDFFPGAEIEKKLKINGPS